MNPPHKDTMLAAFKGVNDRSPDAIMACWSLDGIYDNPMTNHLLGHPAEGFAAVRQCMVNLCESLAQTGHTLVVSRLTAGPHHVVAEWHTEPPDGPPQLPRRGVHIADFNPAGKLKRVTVFPRS